MSFHKSQDNEYLNICLDRVKNIYLTWVEQFLDIIYDKFSSDGVLNTDNKYLINDIGCNVGQFLKGLSRRKINFDYTGYDIENLYLKHAREIFNDYKNSFLFLDIEKEKPRMCDISVISATLEHLNNYQIGLRNIFETTKDLVILRTFLGENSQSHIMKKEKAETYYYINQFSFNDILDFFNENGFNTTIYRDKATDSMPKYLSKGLIRTQFVIVGEKK